MNATLLRHTFVATVLAIGVISCRRAGANHKDTSVPGDGTLTDSLRGVVAVVGNEPQVGITITASGGNPVIVRGATTSELRAVNGIDVAAFGAYSGTAVDGLVPRETPVFTAEHFVVRTVQGVAAHDGVLVRTESGFALQRADGSLSALTAVPATLQAQVGARIFWVGSLNKAPEAYGVIAVARP